MPHPPLDAFDAFDAFEERQVRKLTHSAYAPADGTAHTKLIVRSWGGRRAHETAAELGCLSRLFVQGCMHVTSVGSSA